MTEDDLGKRVTLEPLCVESKNGWCIVNGNPDPEAISDRTLCKHVVILRFGLERRQPTCGECRAEYLRQKEQHISRAREERDE